VIVTGVIDIFNVLDEGVSSHDFFVLVGGGEVIFVVAVRDGGENLVLVEESGVTYKMTKVSD
jgi:hypothetical protein